MSLARLKTLFSPTPLKESAEPGVFAATSKPEAVVRDLDA
jgi:hypothetical protein